MKKNQESTILNETSDLPLVSNEFIEENFNSLQKKSGPHSKKDRFERRQQVFQLHFAKHLSARKIAEQMKMNRKTIDDDIKYWYSNLIKDWKKEDIKGHVIKQLSRLEIQRDRLLDDMDCSPEQKLFTEKLVFDIDQKIALLLIKIDAKDAAIKEEANKIVCDWAHKQGLDFRAIDPWVLANIPVSKYNQILKILNSEVD